MALTWLWPTLIKVQSFKDTSKVTVTLNMRAGNSEAPGRQLLKYRDTELDRPIYTEWCCYLLVHYEFFSAMTATKYRLKHTFHCQLLLPSSTPVPNHLLSDLHASLMLCSIVSYWHFRAVYRSDLQGSSSPITTRLCCVMSQKSKDIIYTTAEARDHAYLLSCKFSLFYSY